MLTRLSDNSLVADPGGSLGQLPPKRLWRPVEWRPFAINAPRFGAHGSRSRDKKYFKRNNSSCLKIRIYVPDFTQPLIEYVISTIGVSKESISKFLIGNRFHVKLRILSPYE